MERTQNMRINSTSLTDGKAVPTRCAFGIPHPTDHVAFSDNRSPHLAWSELPNGTKSLAISCIDVDVPSVGDDVNQEGRTVPASLPRVDFFHWALVNLSPTLGSVAEGAFSSGVTAGGKEGPVGPMGTQSGTNNYSQWFAGDEAMAGNYYGYDGPCPPWNDERLHRYHFTVYALDVASVALPFSPDGPAVLAAIEPHVLSKATIIATYTLNPALGA